MSNYFIKQGYQINEVTITNDEISGKEYWNSQRILSSEMYQFPVYQYAKKFIRSKNLRRVADVGCGVGKKLQFLKREIPSLEITGIDQINAINYCRDNYDFGSWLADDFENSKLELSNKFDLIICADVIEHLYNPDILMAYIHKILSDDGYVILSTPERDLVRGLECKNSPNSHHVREWNSDELIKYMEFSGFKVLSHFVQYPVRFSLNKIFFNEMVKRFLLRKPLKYNQVIVLSKNLI